MEILISITSGFIGAIVGALISGKTISYAHYRQAQKLAADTETKKLLNLFQALYAELSLVWQRYMALIGEDLEKAKDSEEVAFAGIFVSSQAYFSVYDNTAQLLGVLDPDSGKNIIDTYVNLKAYFDELNRFNQLADKQRQVRLQANINLFEAKQMREEVEKYFTYLKKRHLQVKGLTLATLETLKEFISLGQQARTTVKIKV